MAEQIIQFGDYVFPAGTKVAEESNSRTVPVQLLARADGARALTGYLREKRVTLDVMLIGDTEPIPNVADIRDAIEALRATMGAGPARLWLWDDQFYRNMQVEEWPNQYEATWFGRMVKIPLHLVGPDPLQYLDTEETNTWVGPGNGDTHTLTVSQGTTAAAPVISLTVGGSGAQTIAWSLQNNTTGEGFTLAGSVTGGDVIEVDSLHRTVKIGSTDKRALYRGRFITLALGANVLEIGITTGTVDQVQSAWVPRKL